ncbi:MAG: 4-(cytidine 5'-diphospho)-2-C-methyl-D-erythritol kinase [Verrucomicrobia bacterium]|nr:4-(cytidine 5'-diphospho)-2-C-methyl-D-erythritol kinase [Verrucomicrobiota bacterium]
MHWLAPAKINLSLRILGRRPDGFHDLRSLMVPISVFDQLHIEHKDSGDLEFVCEAADIPLDDSNLVVRAVRLFCGTFGFLPRLRVELVKEIPHGAGLGGGSSDAATALLALNSVFQTELSRETMAELAAELGSDVPFFIYQSAAWIGGRGERVEPVQALPNVPLLLVKPPFGVPTPWAYKHWMDSEEIPGVPYAAQRCVAGEVVNDLERPVFQKYFFLADLKTWLCAQPEVEAALMSGSGSTVFAVLRDKSDGYALGERLGQEFGTALWVFLCETIA